MKMITKLGVAFLFVGLMSFAVSRDLVSSEFACGSGSGGDPNDPCDSMSIEFPT